MTSTVWEKFPDAEISLFGDKAKGSINPNSPWDVLILTKNEVPPLARGEIQERLQAITLRTGVALNMLLISKDKWNNAAEYELFRKRIETELVAVN